MRSDRAHDTSAAREYSAMPPFSARKRRNGTMNTSSPAPAPAIALDASPTDPGARSRASEGECADYTMLSCRNRKRDADEQAERGQPPGLGLSA